MKPAFAPRRILLTTDAVGGVWRYTLDLARAWQARGIAVLIAVLGPPPDAARLEEAGGLALISTCLPLDWTAPDERAVREAAEAIAALARAHEAHSLHLHTPALVLDSCSLPAVAVAHSCVRTWWMAMRGTEELPADLAWRARLVARGLHAAVSVIAPSAGFAASLREAYGPCTRITVVHNGRELPPLAGTAKSACALTAGRLWDEAKNVRTLDHAAGRIDIPVQAAGPTQGPNGECFAPVHIRLLGNLAESALADVMAGSRVFVSLALYEPFGLAVLEAAQAGAALVLSDIPTFRELWDGAAVFVDPADDRTVAARLGALAEAPADWGARARWRARAYAVDAMADATLAVHQAATAARPGRRAA
jgi:glycosyltransferase involved in cell wall biosynthesis